MARLAFGGDVKRTMCTTLCPARCGTGSTLGEPHLSGVWEANTNATTPSDTALSSFAGDQLLRGARCRIRKDVGAVA